MCKNIFYKDCCDKFIDYVKKSHNMTENEQKSEKTAQDVQKNCLSLTEQWKNGELERGWYYIKKLLKDRVVMDFYYGNDVDRWMDNYDEEIKQVLAPVPSYDHFVELTEKDKENAKLKELLKEILSELVDENDVTSLGLAEYFSQELLLKLREALK